MLGLPFCRFSSTCFDGVVVHAALIALAPGLAAVGRLAVRAGRPWDLVEPAVLVLGRVDDVLPAAEGKLVAELDAAVSALDHGLHLKERTIWLEFHALIWYLRTPKVLHFMDLSLRSKKLETAEAPPKCLS